MKNNLLKLGIVTIGIFSLVSFTFSDTWFQLTSIAYKYKIEFPEKPEETPNVLETKIGKLKMNMFVYDASKSKTDENLVYLVNFTEYPDSLINSDMKDKMPAFFRNSIDGAVTNVHGKLLSEKDIEKRGFPGREIRVDFKDGLAVIKMRIYLVKNKMYLIEVITETKKDFNKSIDRFMDSFDLLD
jgi:hypothetical protein